MKKRRAALGGLIFFLIAPGTFAGLIPFWITRWQLSPLEANLVPMRYAGILPIAAGLVPLVESFARFALVGLGTPAPVAPPERLVVSGFYRHVRNPMYVGVIAIILGQAILFANVMLLAYAAIVSLAFQLFVLVYEEPTLQGTFGEDYVRFKQNVPRWLPRISPWSGL